MYVYILCMCFVELAVVEFNSQHKLSKYLFIRWIRLFKLPNSRGGSWCYTHGADDDNPIRHTPTVCIYTHIIVLLYGNSGPLPSTIIIGSCIPTRGSPHKVPLLLTLRARWGSRVYQFSGNTFARMTHWEIGKRPTSIIKTRVHYTYLIPRRGAIHCTGINSFLIVCTRRQSFTPQKSDGVDTYDGG